MHTENQRLAAGPGKFKTVIEVLDKLSALLDILGSGGNGNDSKR